MRITAGQPHSRTACRNCGAGCCSIRGLAGTLMAQGPVGRVEAPLWAFPSHLLPQPPPLVLLPACLPGIRCRNTFRRARWLLAVFLLSVHDLWTRIASAVPSGKLTRLRLLLKRR